MRIFFTIAVLTVALCISAQAQDIITKKDGDEIKSKVQEIGQTEIKYKLFNNQNGPLYSISKSEIFMIKYEDGTKDVISQNPQPSPTEDMYAKGQEDAKKSYASYKGAATGTFVSSLLLGPLIGLVPVAATSSSTPKDHNLGYPSAEFMKNTEYSRGYIESAKKKKASKVWQNYLIGSAISIIGISIVVTSG